MTTKIQVRDSGPLLVDADDLTIVDAEGGTFIPSRSAVRPMSLRCIVEQALL